MELTLLNKIILIFLATVTPISELRGGIPMAISLGFNPILAYFSIVVLNILLFFPVTILLKFFHKKYLSKCDLYQRYISHIRNRGKPFVDRYGMLGLALFVAIPLPASGVYSGTILSWLIGMSWQKSFLSISLGAAFAGLIVLFLSLPLAQFIW
ncbi:MAG: hypothetical protein DDT22_00305 [candidate division WS2 bacterium]|nr:hypothetical protein [Candidatus Lithacetigena glycinireducens]MBT9174645.1 hypothetical protein [Candidatus Lithacetigena glycinireducens]